MVFDKWYLIKGIGQIVFDKGYLEIVFDKVYLIKDISAVTNNNSSSCFKLGTKKMRYTFTFMYQYQLSMSNINFVLTLLFYKGSLERGGESNF